MRNYVGFPSFFYFLLGDFNTKVGRERFSDRQSGMRDYIRIVMSKVKVENFATSKNLVINP